MTKKYDVLLTANMDSRDASASKNSQILKIRNPEGKKEKKYHIRHGSDIVRSGATSLSNGIVLNQILTSRNRP